MSVKIKLEKAIELNALIETKNKNSNFWVKTKVLNICGQLLEISQVDEYAASLLMIGDLLDCRIKKGKTITMMTATVYNIKFAAQSVVLKIHSIKTIQNLRKHKRYDIALNAAYCKEGEMSQNHCVVANVSSRGMKIITKSQLNKDNNIEIILNCKKNPPITTECSVRWAMQTEQYNLYGLYIMDIDKKSNADYSDLHKMLQRRERIKDKKLEMI